jgi:hypothetical protein
MKNFKWILPLGIALISFGSPEVTNAQPDSWKHKRVLKGHRMKKFRGTATIFSDRGSNFHPAVNGVGRKTRKENQKKVRSQFPGN